MALNLANSWSAHYARLASAGKDDSSLPGKYSNVLPFASTATACREHLVSVPDCVAMFISPSGRVQLLHHAHWDKATPVYTGGTNSLWALLGAGDSPPVATFDHNLLAHQITKIPVPSWDSLRDAPDAAAFQALQADTSAAAMTLSCNAVVALSPGIAYHLFQANSDDPATLGVALARALNLADIYYDQMGKAPGAVGTGHPVLTPTSDAFFEACSLLWLASQTAFTDTVALEILSVGPPILWAHSVRDAHIVSTMPGPGPSLSTSSQATENLTEVCGLLRDSIVDSTAQRLHATSTKGFRKIPIFTQKMILRASEPSPSGYADSNGTLLRTEPVAEYAEVLATTSSSHALSVTMHYMRDIFKCSVQIPASLANSIYHGQFRWSSMFSRGAFSIFSLPPASASGRGAIRSDEERVQLELEATEGKGISAGQAQSTAKIHHSAIHNPPSLQDFLHNKLHINVLVFGRLSPLSTFIQTWSRHTVTARESYELLSDADPSFCSRVGHIIDMAEQAYFSSCIEAATTLDIDTSMLDHSTLRSNITMGMMPAIVIPRSLAAMVLQNPAHRRAQVGSSNDDPPTKRLKIQAEPPPPKDKEREKVPKTPPRKLVTRIVPPNWDKILQIGKNFYTLTTALDALGTTLQCPSPICGKLLLRGRCTEKACFRDASHAFILALDKPQNAIVEKWFTSACKEHALL